MTKTTKSMHADVMTVFMRGHSQSLTNRLSGLPDRGTSRLITTSDGEAAQLGTRPLRGSKCDRRANTKPI